jgi:uncharacterized membrane protein YgdD (TMEM256/DUF423 family)
LMRPRQSTGRDTWACRLVGGSQNPHESITAETGVACQCACERVCVPQGRGGATDEESAAMKSRQLAGVVGPALVAIGVTEALNLHIFDTQIPQVVYLNGTILFVSGVALVRTHNRWTWNWSTLITIIGWALLVGGLYRMVAPEAPQAEPESYATFAVLVIAGLYLSFKGYGAEAAPTPVHLENHE